MDPHIERYWVRDGRLEELRLTLEAWGGAVPDEAGCAASLESALARAAPLGPRRLFVGGTRDGTADLSSLIEVVIAMRPPLETLALGDFVFRAPDRYTPSRLVQARLPAELWTALPGLRDLVVHADDIPLFGGDVDIRHQSLRRLVIRSGALSPETAIAVGCAELPELTHLDLWLGDFEYQWDGHIRDLAPLLSGEGVPHMRHLRMCTDITDEFAAALAGTPMLARLATLDLSGCCLTDAGAAAIADDRGAFAHLEWINVDANLLTPAGRRLIAEACPTAYLGSQRSDLETRVAPDPRHLR